MTSNLPEEKIVNAINAFCGIYVLNSNFTFTDYFNKNWLKNRKKLRSIPVSYGGVYLSKHWYIWKVSIEMPNQSNHLIFGEWIKITFKEHESDDEKIQRIAYEFYRSNIDLFQSVLDEIASFDLE